MRHVTAILLVLSLSLLITSNARVHSSRLSIFAFRRNKGWQFLDRMNMQPGNITIDLKVQLETTDAAKGAMYELELMALPDLLWQK